jgi:hypothetical protein
LGVEGYLKPTKVVFAQFDSFTQYYIINNDIHITKNHPFLANQQDTDMWSWIDAPDLKVGDRIRGIDDWVDVTSIVKVNEIIHVKTLNVEEKDTYFAGNIPVVVHNDGIVKQ